MCFPPPPVNYSWTEKKETRTLLARRTSYEQPCATQTCWARRDGMRTLLRRKELIHAASVAIPCTAPHYFCYVGALIILPFPKKHFGQLTVHAQKTPCPKKTFWSTVHGQKRRRSQHWTDVATLRKLGLVRATGGMIHVQQYRNYTANSCTKQNQTKKSRHEPTSYTLLIVQMIRPLALLGGLARPRIDFCWCLFLALTRMFFF